jgi:hypothetical protein
MLNHAKQANQFVRLRSGIAAAATQFTVCVAGVFALSRTGSALLSVFSEITFDAHRFAEGPVPRPAVTCRLPREIDDGW